MKDDRRAKAFALAALIFTCCVALAASGYSWFAWRKAFAAHEAGAVAVDEEALTAALTGLQALFQTEALLWLIALALAGIVAWLEWKSGRASGPGRPAVAVAHAVLYTDRMAESARFMRAIGMRAISDGPEVSVYEMRGGTHLIMMKRDQPGSGEASFDLMVDDLREAHRRFTELGLSPSGIEARPRIDHEVFTVREPAGHVITFFSSHASGKPT